MTTPELIKVREGITDLLVPAGHCARGPGRRTGQVFYNRQMEFGRDISVIFGRESLRPGQRILDGLAATGARGLRLANECGVKADFELNDKDLRAAVLIKQNAELNCLDHVTVHCRDLRSLLADEAFDYIDIDPFGTPVQFVDAALQSCRNRGIIALTATDTAPLYGAYPKTCWRRYGALSAKAAFAHETGLRILIGFVVREAAKLDRAVEPLLCYHADHYFRCYLRIVDGAARADAALRRIGYVRFDPRKLTREIVDEPVGGALAGPLWTGDLFAREVVRSMNATGDLGTAARCAKFIELWREEAGMPPLFYSMDELARRTKLSPPKLSDFIAILQERGARASRTHFDPKGVKTDLTAGDLLRIYRCSAARLRAKSAVSNP